ncbi:MAG: leucine-rich repeat domain-containing protein [Anaerolineaceae bacterium]|nr:leucine-rich repeat domain-containing protein [Anaerolineaceae bacterium]
MNKRILFFLSLFLFLLLSPVSGQDNLTYKNWSLTENNTGWTVTKYTGNESAVTIPEMINEIPVTQLAAELFMNHMNLESVVIPDTVTTIGRNAFFGCTSLKDVKISEQVKSIPDGCFRYCLSLEKIDLPYVLTSIGKDAFSDCPSLTSIYIPANVTTIGETAFAYCQNLAEISFPRKITTINADAFLGTPWFEAQTDEFVFVGRGILLKYNGIEKNVEIPNGTVSISNAFQGNLQVESVTLPDTVLRITQNAFRDASNLTSINIPEQVTTIAASAFEGCRKLTSINIPDTVTSLGGSVFRYCDSLTKLDLPSNIRSLPSRFAGDCPNLQNVRIPGSVTAIDKNAFLGSNNIQLLITPGSSAEAILNEYEMPFSYYHASNNDFSYTINGSEIEIVKYLGENYDVEIPAQITGLPVTSISQAAFQGSEIVRSVSLPITIKRIGDEAFSNMPNLENIYFSFGLEKIGSNAFSGSNDLLELSIPDGVRSIGDNIVDLSAKTFICAHPGSYAEQFLIKKGYWVYSPENCTEISKETDKWASENLRLAAECDCSDCGNTDSIVKTINGQIENYSILRISNDTQTITEEMLLGTETDLFLYVPESVNSIDAQILTDRNVTIVGTPGSYAENFADTNGLRFISLIITNSR